MTAMSIFCWFSISTARSSTARQICAPRLTKCCASAGYRRCRRRRSSAWSATACRRWSPALLRRSGGERGRSGGGVAALPRDLRGQRDRADPALSRGARDPGARCAGAAIAPAICTNKPQQATIRVLEGLGLARCSTASPAATASRQKARPRPSARPDRRTRRRRRRGVR